MSHVATPLKDNNIFLIIFPFFLDLCPKNGSQTEKFELNAVRLLDHKPAVGLRCSRFNHSCNPNVHFWQVEGTNTIVYYSSRLIKAGDEICVTYRTIWADLVEDKEALHRSMLLASLNFKMKWGIFCPPDCICNDFSILPVLSDFSRMLRTAIKSGSEEDFETSLEASKERLQICNTHPRMSGILDIKVSTLFDAYCAAVALKGQKGVKEATAFLKERHEIITQLEFPGSEKSLEYKGLLDEPPSKAAVQRRFCIKYDMLFNKK